MKNNEELIEGLKKSSIELDDGVSIERAEVVLSQAKEQGVNACVILYVNGDPVRLYSLFEDVDDWYQKAVGMKKQQWNEKKRRVMQEYEEENERYRLAQIAEYEGKIPEFVERGKKYMYPQKMKDWAEFVDKVVHTFPSRVRPQAVDDALNVMELLRMGVSYDDVYKVLWQLHPDDVTPARNMVLNYSKYGPDFIIEKFPELYKTNKEYVDKLVAENEGYASQPGNGE